jgi:hypothetical protein
MPICVFASAAVLQDLSRKPGANSCRSGAVVHLLAANGAKLPVKLKMTTREDARDGRVTHVVQVSLALNVL